MSIIQLPTPISANTGVIPNIKTMTVTDSLATLTTAGYLNKNSLEGFPIATSDILHVLYNYNTTTNVGTFGIFSVSINAGTGLITLTEDTTSSEVTYTAPSVANAIAVFTNTTGNISDNIAATNTIANSSATPGTVRSITGAITETATVITSGNLVGVRGVVNYVGASGGFIYGTQGKLIPTGTLSGSDWSAGIFGQLDISAATVNAGQIAPIWADYGASSGTITSATGMRMFAGTNTTAATLNSMIYLYGKASNLFELSLNGSTYVASGGSGVLSGTIQKIALTIGGVQYYIPCATVIS